MTEPTLMQRRTFGESTVLDRYGLGPIQTGSGAFSADRQAVENLNTLQHELIKHGHRQREQASTLTHVQREHVKAINDAAAAVAARESKPASMVTQAEINAELEATLSPTHKLIRIMRASTVMDQEYAALAAKIIAAAKQMRADGLIE